PWDTGGSVRAEIGLGANRGERDGTLAAAVAALAATPGLRLVGGSRLYATRPVGPAGQPEYRNAVAAVDSHADGPPETAAAALLRTLKELERRFGRKPRKRWAPRELDLDLLIFGRHRLSIHEP